MSSLISTTGDLAAFCTRAAAFPAVAVDTEFMRERTYWPVLCLVQAATPEEAVAVDALAEGVDLAPLFALMADRGVLKVFHSARQDLEIFHHLSGEVPAPLFDTQVAAMACGYGDSTGYDKLVRDVTGHAVDKAHQFTDWTKRPLDRKRLDYALGDVTHLRDVHASLSARIADGGRSAWLDEEMAVLADPTTYRNDPDAAWKRLKPRSRKPLGLAALRELAAWREREARARNVPRNRVVGDRVLTEVASALPGSAAELRSLRGVERVSKEAAESMAEIVARTRASDPSSWPTDDRPSSTARGPVVDLLKMALKMKCDAHGVAPKLVASAADLAALAEDDDADVPALRGWRREIFGADALRLKRGEVAVVIRDSRPILASVRRDPEARG